MEEVPSYNDVAAYPPHEQAYPSASAASSRRPSFGMGSLRQPLASHGGLLGGSARPPLRCADAGEVDIDADLGIDPAFGFDIRTAPAASPSPDAPGFEMDFE